MVKYNIIYIFKLIQMVSFNVQTFKTRKKLVKNSQ